MAHTCAPAALPSPLPPTPRPLRPPPEDAEGPRLHFKGGFIYPTDTQTNQNVLPAVKVRHKAKAFLKSVHNSF